MVLCATLCTCAQPPTILERKQAAFENVISAAEEQINGAVNDKVAAVKDAVQSQVSAVQEAVHSRVSAAQERVQGAVQQKVQLFSGGLLVKGRR